MGLRYTEEEYRALIQNGNKQSKYRNTKTEIDGITFDSKREATRYIELKALEIQGAITDLMLQRKFPLMVNDHLICVYIADFSYKRAGTLVIEDAKGRKIQPYPIKKKLMKALLNITIVEI